VVISRARHLQRLAIVAGLLILGAMVFYRALLLAAVTPNPMANQPASIKRGAVLWANACATCHGPEGRGDGPATAGLARKPKDLTRIARPPVFPDGVLAYRIANGGVVMPAWGSVLSEQDIWDLVSFIRAQHQ
jgi:mono/diheme cytochrome c family protein